MNYKYVIISPVRNEEDYVELTLKSIINQTILPAEFILINDGSTDRTAEIIEKYTQKYPWIKKIDKEDRGYYLPGTGVVDTFYKGFDKISIPDWNFVVKLDCDLEFEPNYFENILREFDKDPRLGIASGCTYIPVEDNKLIQEPTQEDHPVGPSKIYRRECWEAINGLKPIPGWDLADLLSAQMNGWNTVCFFDLKLKHYRITGSRRKGVWQPKHLQGRFEYRHGYNFGYTVLKAFRHLFSKPAIIGSVAKITGYVYAAINREDYLFDSDMRKFLRKKHSQFIKQKLRIIK